MQLKLAVNETALLVVDMQNGFIKDEGSLGRAGLNMELCKATVEPVKRLIEEARRAGIIDIWTVQEHYPNDITKVRRKTLSHIRKCGASISPALVRTWDSEIISDLKPYLKPDTEIIRKNRFSAFLDTRLETLLRMKGIKFLIICGVSTPLCVETTTRDAYQKDYDVIVVKDAVATSDLKLHENSLYVIGYYFADLMDADKTIELIKNSN